MFNSNKTEIEELRESSITLAKQHNQLIKEVAELVAALKMMAQNNNTIKILLCTIALESGIDEELFKEYCEKASKESKRLTKCAHLESLFER